MVSSCFTFWRWVSKKKQRLVLDLENNVRKGFGVCGRRSQVWVRRKIVVEAPPKTTGIQPLKARWTLADCARKLICCQIKTGSLSNLYIIYNITYIYIYYKLIIYVVRRTFKSHAPHVLPIGGHVGHFANSHNLLQDLSVTERAPRSSLSFLRPEGAPQLGFPHLLHTFLKVLLAGLQTQWNPLKAKFTTIS